MGRKRQIPSQLQRGTVEILVRPNGRWWAFLKNAMTASLGAPLRSRRSGTISAVVKLFIRAALTFSLGLTRLADFPSLTPREYCSDNLTNWIWSGACKRARPADPDKEEDYRFGSVN